MTVKKRLTISNIIMITAPVAAVLLVGALCIGALYFAMNRSNGFGFSDSNKFYSSMQTISDKMYEVFEHSKSERINRLNILATVIDRNTMYMLVYENGKFFYDAGNSELYSDSLLDAARDVGGKAFVSNEKNQLYYYYTDSGSDHYDLFLFNTASHTDNDIVKTVMIISAVVIIIAVLLTVILTNRFLSKFTLKKIEYPLDILSHGVDEISKGNLDYRLEYNEADEFAPICRDFNFMAQTLKKSVELTRRNEENRKELLLGISHDLRSPLTSIQAYVEGLMTGVANTPEMQQKYLSTIKRKTQDIEHMVSALLAYSKLDMEVFSADIKVVDMNAFLSEAVNSVCDEYKAKGLNVTLLCPAEVKTDINEELFLRIITNLFDNSLKYKVKAQGTCAVIVTKSDTGCSVEFADDGPGCAAGTLSVSANYDADYELYWGDADGERLTSYDVSGNSVNYSRFADVDVYKGSGQTTLSEFAAIPDGAQTVLLVYDGDTLSVSDVPESKQRNDGDPVYTFGVLSDVHFNRYTVSGADVTETAFPRALDFFTSNGASFVGVCGDLSSRGEASAYERFNAISSQYDFPVYSCKGNHDCYEKFRYTSWRENMNPGVFSDSPAPGVLSTSDNGYDFVYSINGDIFIFLSQISSTYAPYTQILTDAQLDWLSEQLDKYSSQRVYLFFHTFLNAPALPYAMGEGNLINDYGASYSLPYFKGNKDEVRFRKLLTDHKNVIFFNGHSHWAYSMQSYNPRLNITDYDGTTATMVHVSSVAAPRTSDIRSIAIVSNPGTMSEGLIVKVYPDHVVTSGVDFINGELLAYAYYNISEG